MNNNFTVQNELITFRKAREDDNMEEISKLIYDTDPYIYPYWFKNDEEEAISFLKEKLKEENFFFNYNNLYVAYNETTNKIIGIINSLDNSNNLDYDYSELERVNENFNKTINNYLKVIINKVKDNDYLYISNICIDGNYRGIHIVTNFLKYFINQMEEAGFEEFFVDCLIDNLRAKNLFQDLDFNEMEETTGFDGKLSVVSMKRKKDEYLPSEYKNFV